MEAGADGLVMINTLLGTARSTSTPCVRTLGGVTGGLSGPAIRPVAVRAVWQVARRCRASRSSASAASGPAPTRWSSWPRVPPPCRSARRSSTTRARRSGSSASCAPSSPRAAFAKASEAIGLAHTHRRRSPPTRGPPMTEHGETVRGTVSDRAAIDGTRAAVRRHRPAREPAVRLGARRRPARAGAVRDDRASRRSAAEVAVLKPQSAFFERHGSARHRRAGEGRRGRARGRGAGAARRQARRHRLDHAGVRRRVPATRRRRWRSTR